MYDLDYSIRHELPKMVISMHVYTERGPRFLLVNGKRIAEGESIENTVLVQRIVPDGFECEFRGQRFFYPRA